MYLISIRLNIINLKNNSTNIEKLEHMEYIYDKIIPIIEFEKLHIIMKKLCPWVKAWLRGLFGLSHL
jgi:hypothetical protein